MPFTGQLIFYAGAAPPNNLAPCNGALTLTAGNEILAALLGKAGTSQFLLPDYQSRTLFGFKPFADEIGGVEGVAINIDSMPSHSHSVGAHATATVTDPSGAVFAGGGPNSYASGPPNSTMGAVVGSSGSGDAHDNMPPWLCLNILICVAGGQAPA